MSVPLHPALAAALAAGLCLALPARATSVMTEATAGKGLFGISLLGDIPIEEDRTYVTVCAATSRTRDGAPGALQLCGGFDHAFTESWVMNATVSFSPRSQYTVDLLGELAPDRFLYRAFNSSLGGSAGLSYLPADLGGVQVGFDLSAGFTAYALPHEWVFRAEDGRVTSRRVAGGVVLARPAAGATLFAGRDTELGLRGSYYLYSANPLDAGRITAEELQRLGTFIGEQFEAYFTEHPEELHLADRLAEYLQATIGGGILQADAMSGMAAAPILFELRAGLSHRFNRQIRGELSYTFDRYVPTMGFAHILSTRWTLRFNDNWRLWGALALQTDVPEDALRSSVGLLTLGGEFSW